MTTLTDRAREDRIKAPVVWPRLNDFNEDLRLLGIDELKLGAG